MHYPTPNIPLSLSVAAPRLLEAAQEVYDAWEQVDGFDSELGAGGICQDIASRMVDALSSLGIDDALCFHASVGENHVYVVASIPADGVYAIDIPPQVYETGSGYVWRRKDGVVFDLDDLVIDRIAEAMDADEFQKTYGEW